MKVMNKKKFSKRKRVHAPTNYDLRKNKREELNNSSVSLYFPLYKNLPNRDWMLIKRAVLSVMH